ncbi:superoxide dismutase [Acuticoccus mangrovi]|uniref:Superoxide dismutase n=1 Tax=Acuticoccus mangrovi TaxID=2796142 RepID=A0A934MEY4_9HYPH|nr:superoxide dismutase [Acuticoccus mangrovi]MBJ3774883.1 superoxide dismutase [Fe] [Acuticoccus mangrovi]
MLTRRSVLALGATATAVLACPSLGRAAAPFEPPPLPYAPDDLAPVISRRTVELHSGIHHRGYFRALNQLVAGTDYADLSLDEVASLAFQNGDVEIANNAGQAWNHILYFDQFAGGPSEPEGALAEALGREFGGVEGFADEAVAASGRVFGTGWLWLLAEGDALYLASTEDGDTPLPSGMVALVGLDLWEHAYYLDYENRKADHLRALIGRLINWQRVGERFV